MAKKLTSVLGVDIGTHSIKVCEIKSQGRQAVISALGLAPTPEGAVDHTGIYNSDAVGLALKQAIAKSGASTPNVVISVAGQQSVLVRTLEVPRMDPTQELKTHMDWEINRSIPFSETTIESDYKVLPDEDVNSPNIDVVMAMATKTAIDTVLECIKKAGRKPYAIDVEPLGLARSVDVSYGDIYGREVVCLVDMGHMTTQINIYRGANLMLPRPVPLGGEMITRAVAEALQVGVAEAETYKQTSFAIPAEFSASMPVDPFADPYGATTSFDPSFSPFQPESASAVPDLDINPVTGLPMGASDVVAPTYGSDPFASSEPMAEPMMDTIVPVSTNMPQPAMMDPQAEVVMASVGPILQEIVDELRRSIDYYGGKGGSVSRVIICGGASKLKGLDSFLSRALGLPCDMYDPTRHLSVSLKKVAPEMVGDTKQEFAVAIGNGLHILFD